MERLWPGWPARGVRMARHGFPPSPSRRYTSAMKIAVPSRQRRLLVLCAASAAVHLALLELVARHGGAGPAALPTADPLVLRLAPAAPPSAAQVVPAAAIPVAVPPAPALPRPVAPARSVARSVARPAPVAPAPPAAPLANPGLAPVQEEAAPPSPALPGRYRVRLPAPVRLDYTLAMRRPGAEPVAAGTAAIAWETDGQHYRLRADGVFGRLASDGERGDVGLLPGSAVDGADGSARTTVFDHVAGIVHFDGGAPDAPAALGIQDRASLLIQLAGIGLAARDQVAGTLAVVVADAGAATVVRFRVLGEETVDTGLGSVAAWHLAEVAAPGRPRLELWLAPAQDWLPVRLSVTGADGNVAIQTLAAATRTAAVP